MSEENPTTDVEQAESRSLRDIIKEAKDGRSEIVTVPEWDNVKIEVRSMNGEERGEYLRAAYDPETETVDFVSIYPSLLVATCHDPESGDKLFTEDDAAWLNTKNARALERLAEVAMELAGMNEKAADKAGKGSSGATPTSTES